MNNSQSAFLNNKIRPMFRGLSFLLGIFVIFASIMAFMNIIKVSILTTILGMPLGISFILFSIYGRWPLIKK